MISSEGFELLVREDASRLDGRPVDDVALVPPCRDEAHKFWIDRNELWNRPRVKPQDCQRQHFGGNGTGVVVIHVQPNIADRIEVMPILVRNDAGKADQIAP